MKLSMPTVKGFGNAMRVHGMYGGMRQHGPVKFGGIRQRGPVQFGGMKRRKRVVRRALQGGMARLPMNSYSFAHGRKVRRMGRGFLDTLKNIGSKALGIARSIPIASTALGLMGQPGASGIARTLGLARRRRRVGVARRRVGVARHRRRVGVARRRVGVARHRRRVGVARRRVGVARHRRRVRHGRGLLSSLLGMTGLARHRVRRRRVGTARKVGYRRLLNVPHF